MRAGEGKMIDIALASGAADFELGRWIIAEYAETPEVNGCFRNLPGELAGLAELYTPPRGRLFLARSASEAVGCAGIHLLGDDTAEMKRLYVRPAFRGQGTGRALIEAIIGAAREMDLRALRLDTLPSMETAAALYRRVGFREIPPYKKMRILENATFMEFPLDFHLGTR
ncbi:MAG TPA: GNAT family N-acetyltransferase [Nitrospinae bacterium]|nr:GNAT family N-acetyltransferase [Nitrospinota bacterium]